MKRRAWLFGTTAVVAVGAGAGLAIWQRRRSTDTTEAAAPGARTEFERPEGGKLALANFQGKPLLLNFWATWCAPCVREMPLLDSFAKQQPGWQVVGLAVDQIGPVREFLAKRPVAYPIGIAGVEALEWVRSLGNTGGGLPFSVAFDSHGAPVQRKLGEIHPEELSAWVAAVR